MCEGKFCVFVVYTLTFALIKGMDLSLRHIVYIVDCII